MLSVAGQLKRQREEDKLPQGSEGPPPLKQPRLGIDPDVSARLRSPQPLLYPPPSAPAAAAEGALHPEIKSLQVLLPSSLASRPATGPSGPRGQFVFISPYSGASAIAAAQGVSAMDTSEDQPVPDVAAAASASTGAAGSFNEDVEMRDAEQEIKRMREQKSPTSSLPDAFATEDVDMKLDEQEPGASAAAAGVAEPLDRPWTHRCSRGTFYVDPRGYDLFGVALSHTLWVGHPATRTVISQSHQMLPTDSRATVRLATIPHDFWFPTARDQYRLTPPIISSDRSRAMAVHNALELAQHLVAPIADADTKAGGPLFGVHASQLSRAAILLLRHRARQQLMPSSWRDEAVIGPESRIALVPFVAVLDQALLERTVKRTTHLPQFVRDNLEGVHAVDQVEPVVPDRDILARELVTFMRDELQQTASLPPADRGQDSPWRARHILPWTELDLALLAKRLPDAYVANQYAGRQTLEEQRSNWRAVSMECVFGDHVRGLIEHSLPPGVWLRLVDVLNQLHTQWRNVRPASSSSSLSFPTQLLEVYGDQHPRVQLSDEQRQRLASDQEFVNQVLMVWTRIRWQLLEPSDPCLTVPPPHASLDTAAIPTQEMNDERHLRHHMSTLHATLTDLSRQMSTGIKYTLVSHGPHKRATSTDRTRVLAELLRADREVENVAQRAATTRRAHGILPPGAGILPEERKKAASIPLPLGHTIRLTHERFTDQKIRETLEATRLPEGKTTWQMYTRPHGFYQPLPAGQQAVNLTGSLTLATASASGSSSSTASPAPWIRQLPSNRAIDLVPASKLTSLLTDVLQLIRLVMDPEFSLNLAGELQRTHVPGEAEQDAVYREPQSTPLRRYLLSALWQHLPATTTTATASMMAIEPLSWEQIQARPDWYLLRGTALTLRRPEHGWMHVDPQLSIGNSFTRWSNWPSQPLVTGVSAEFKGIQRSSSAVGGQQSVSQLHVYVDTRLRTVVYSGTLPTTWPPWFTQAITTMSEAAMQRCSLDHLTVSTQGIRAAMLSFFKEWQEQQGETKAVLDDETILARLRKAEDEARKLDLKQLSVRHWQLQRVAFLERGLEGDDYGELRGLLQSHDTPEQAFGGAGGESATVLSVLDHVEQQRVALYQEYDAKSSQTKAEIKARQDGLNRRQQALNLELQQLQAAAESLPPLERTQVDTRITTLVQEWTGEAGAAMQRSQQAVDAIAAMKRQVDQEASPVTKTLQMYRQQLKIPMLKLFLLPFGALDSSLRLVLDALPTQDLLKDAVARLATSAGAPGIPLSLVLGQLGWQQQQQQLAKAQWKQELIEADHIKRLLSCLMLHEAAVMHAQGSEPARNLSRRLIHELGRLRVVHGLTRDGWLEMIGNTKQQLESKSPQGELTPLYRALTQISDDWKNTLLLLPVNPSGATEINLTYRSKQPAASGDTKQEVTIAQQQQDSLVQKDSPLATPIVPAEAATPQLENQFVVAENSSDLVLNPIGFLVAAEPIVTACHIPGSTHRHVRTVKWKPAADMEPKLASSRVYFEIQIIQLKPRLVAPATFVAPASSPGLSLTPSIGFALQQQRPPVLPPPRVLPEIKMQRMHPRVVRSGVHGDVIQVPTDTPETIVAQVVATFHCKNQARRLTVTGFELGQNYAVRLRAVGVDARGHPVSETRWCQTKDPVTQLPLTKPMGGHWQFMLLDTDTKERRLFMFDSKFEMVNIIPRIASSNTYAELFAAWRSLFQSPTASARIARSVKPYDLQVCDAQLQIGEDISCGQYGILLTQDYMQKRADNQLARSFVFRTAREPLVAPRNEAEVVTDLFGFPVGGFTPKWLNNNLAPQSRDFDVSWHRPDVLHAIRSLPSQQQQQLSSQQMSPFLEQSVFRGYGRAWPFAQPQPGFRDESNFACIYQHQYHCAALARVMRDWWEKEHKETAVFKEHWDQWTGPRHPVASLERLVEWLATSASLDRLLELKNAEPYDHQTQLKKFTTFLD